MNLALKGFEFRDERPLRFSPNQPFLLRGVLFWQGTGILSSLRIAGEEQIVMSLPLEVLECPLPIERVYEQLKEGTLEAALPNYLTVMQFASSNAGNVIEAEVAGSFETMLFWGVIHQ